MDYFLQKDIDVFTSLANKPYNKNEPEDKLGGHFVRTRIFDKVSYWGELVANELGYEVLPNNSWLKPYLSRFREYAWCRIFPDENNHQLFFNVEVNAEESSLIIKMDCKFSGTESLDSDKVKLFREYIDDKKYLGQCVRWFIIDIAMYTNFSDLVKFSKNFILENLHYYKEVNSLLSNSNLLETIEDIKLEKVDASKIKLIEDEIETNENELLQKKPGFYDKTHTNPVVSEPNSMYIQRDLENKKLGDYGEEIIKVQEQRRINVLKSQGIISSDKNVVKQKDIVGYDLLSYDDNGEEIHIEVKTTRGDKNSTFYMSYNEVRVMESDPKWRLYRIHSLSNSNLSARFFVLDKEKMQLKIDFQVKSYYCKIK